MEFNETDPLYYTSKESNAQILFNKGISVFMLGITFLCIYFMYLIVDEGMTEDGDIAGLVAIGICAIATGVGAFYVYYGTNRHKRFLRQFQLHDDRIDEKLTYPKQGKEKKNRITFDQVDRIIVGSFTETSFSVIMRILMHLFQPSKYFSLVIVVYRGNYFLKKISSQNEMDQWMGKFKRANLPVFFTDYDLSLAYLGYEKGVDIYFEGVADTLLPNEQENILVEKQTETSKRMNWIPESLSDYLAWKHKKVRAIMAVLLFLLCIPMVYLEENEFDNAGTAIMIGILFIPIFGLICRKLAGWRDLVYIYVTTCFGGTIGVVLFNIILGDIGFFMILYPWIFVSIIAVFWIAFFLIARLIWYILEKMEWTV